MSKYRIDYYDDLAINGSSHILSDGENPLDALRKLHPYCKITKLNNDNEAIANATVQICHGAWYNTLYKVHCFRIERIVPKVIYILEPQYDEYSQSLAGIFSSKEKAIKAAKLLEPYMKKQGHKIDNMNIEVRKTKEEKHDKNYVFALLNTYGLNVIVWDNLNKQV